MKLEIKKVWNLYELVVFHHTFNQGVQRHTSATPRLVYLEAINRSPLSTQVGDKRDLAVANCSKNAVCDSQQCGPGEAVQSEIVLSGREQVKNSFSNTARSGILAIVVKKRIDRELEGSVDLEDFSMRSTTVAVERFRPRMVPSKGQISSLGKVLEGRLQVSFAEVINTARHSPRHTYLLIHLAQL